MILNLKNTKKISNWDLEQQKAIEFKRVFWFD